MRLSSARTWGEQDARLALEIRVLGDVSHRLVDFAASLVGDDHLERVLETPAAVGFVERPVVFVMVGAERLLHADGARLHASTQIVAVVAFLERQFAQVDRHAAQRVVDDADDVAHLLEVSLSNVSLCFNSSICFCRSSMSRSSRRMRSRGSTVSCMRACSISMMMLLACAPDSAFVVSSSRSSASIARWARAVRRYR